LYVNDQSNHRLRAVAIPAVPVAAPPKEGIVASLLNGGHGNGGHGNGAEKKSDAERVVTAMVHARDAMVTAVGGPAYAVALMVAVVVVVVGPQCAAALRASRRNAAKED
jgi:hypothetical protein